MPYIKEQDRRFAKNNPVGPGELNFSITHLIDRYLRREGVCYSTLNEVIGALECAKLELYRRIAAPYEDRKIQENGDVYTPGLEPEQPPLRGDSPETCNDPHCC